LIGTADALPLGGANLSPGSSNMRLLAALLLGTTWAVLGACSDPCEDKTGKSTCGYCSEDRLATSNPHAGMCRYCGEGTTCSGNICSDNLRCVRKVNLFVPKATFHKGKAPVATSSGSAPPVRHITPTTGGVTLTSSVTWTVEWEVTVVVTAILFEVTEFDGYYEVPVSAEEASAGTLSFVTAESTSLPGESGCLGPTTCWTEAPAERTTADGQVALVGGGDVGQPQGGIGLTWEAPSYSQSTTPNPGTGCPTSAAQAGCCTTSGGIQIAGFGLDSSCQCPSDTCAVGTTYCGCPACGGC
jgi:hypothetical protein